MVHSLKERFKIIVIYCEEQRIVFALIGKYLKNPIDQDGKPIFQQDGV